jgi:hypothetical protein
VILSKRGWLFPASSVELTLEKTADFRLTFIPPRYDIADVDQLKTLDTKYMKGLIFIPDITGFTDFVRETDMNLGAAVMHELLSEIIDSNQLDLDISEIEGDAVLFYKIGQPIPLSQIFVAFNNMYEAFNKKYRELSARYKINLNLSLKFILHYGEMSVYYIKGFKKLYGQTIIESHRLLKNGSGNSDYILITDDYIKAVIESKAEFQTDKLNGSSYVSQDFTDLRKIGFYFFNYSSGGYGRFFTASQNNIA